MNHPNYAHRAFIGDAKAENFESSDLMASIGVSVEQAEAIIFQMQSQYIGDSDQLSNPDNYCTLEVIRKELLDIKAIVNWHCENTKVEVKS